MMNPDVENYARTEYTPLSGDQLAPPSYDESVFGKLRAAAVESRGDPLECVKQTCKICFKSIVGTICLALVFAVPIAMIAIGSVYLHSCPRQRFIPIYLIVGGCFGILHSLLMAFLRAMNQRENTEEDNHGCLNLGNSVLSCFLLAWIIAGSVWVYTIHGDFTTAGDPRASDYCHPVVYWFTFYEITIVWCLTALLCCCFFTGALCAAVCNQ